LALAGGDVSKPLSSMEGNVLSATPKVE